VPPLGGWRPPAAACAPGCRGFLGKPVEGSDFVELARDFVIVPLQLLGNIGETLDDKTNLPEEIYAVGIKD
jgi:hypothetical protein